MNQWYNQARTPALSNVSSGDVIPHNVLKEGEFGLDPVGVKPLPLSERGYFEGGNYKAYTLKRDVRAFRVFGGKSPQKGYYVTYRQNVISQSTATEILALKPGYNLATNVAEVIIPKGTTIYTGHASSVYGRQGGGFQAYIPDKGSLQVLRTWRSK